MIALWSTLTPTSASEWWHGRFYLASATRLLDMILGNFHSQSGLSDPWLWDSHAFVPWLWPLTMLMSSDSVSDGENRFRVDYEPWWGAAGRLTRYRSSRFWTRVGLVSDTCLLNLLGVTPVTWGTKPADLPECCRVGVSPVSLWSYAEYRLLETDYCNDERDGSNWSSQISTSLMKHGFGCPGDQSAMGGYNKRVNSVRWPIQMLFNRMKHDWVGCCTRSSPQAVTITGVEYSWLAYSNLWFNTVRCKLFVFLLPSLFFKENENRMLCAIRWRPTTGWRTSNTLIPNVGDKSVNAEVQATFVMKKNLHMRESKIHAKRERER